MMVRWSTGKELRQQLRNYNISDVLRRCRLRWFGHVERKDDGDWVKACQKLEVAGDRGSGSGKKMESMCSRGHEGGFIREARFA
jgi:hypothetical protein